MEGGHWYRDWEGIYNTVTIIPTILVMSLVSILCTNLTLQTKTYSVAGIWTLWVLFVILRSIVLTDYFGLRINSGYTEIGSSCIWSENPRCRLKSLSINRANEQMWVFWCLRCSSIFLIFPLLLNSISMYRHGNVSRLIVTLLLALIWYNLHISESEQKGWGIIRPQMIVLDRIRKSNFKAAEVCALESRLNAGNYMSTYVYVESRSVGYIHSHISCDHFPSSQ